MEFEIFSVQCLLYCIACFFTGLVDAISGGGGLIIVPTMIMIGVPTHYITGTNQCSACLGSFAAMYNYMKNGKIHYRSAIFTVPFAIIGSYLGARLNLLIPEQYLKIFMLAMIPIVAIFMIVNKTSGDTDSIDELSNKMIAVRSAIIGLVFGGYQGFYGPGAGMFFMLAYVMLLKLSLIRATSNTKVVVAAASITSTITYAISGNILWKLVAVAIIFNIIGSYFGAGLAIKKGSKIIRPIMFVVVALLFVKILFDAIA